MAMTLRLDEADENALRETARREQRSMQEVAKTAIRQYVTGHAAQRQQIVSRILAEDENLLKRLA